MKITIDGREFDYGRHDRNFFGWWAKPVENPELWGDSTHGFTAAHALALAYQRWVLKRGAVNTTPGVFEKPCCHEKIKEILRHA